MNWAKLRLIGVIILLIFGAAFFIFAFFFNRSTLQISATAPFTINVMKIKSESCSSSPCSITVAPGHYQITLTQTDSLPITDEIDLPLGQTTAKSYTFKPAPKLNLTAAIEPKEISTVADGITFFPNQKGDQLYFIADSPINAQPTFYRINAATAPAEPFKDAEALLYFTRAIKKYQLKVSPNQQKIALIDQTDPESQSLYLLDLQAKSRQALEQNQQFTAVKWLNDNDLLVQRRNLQTILDELYLYRQVAPNQVPVLLDLVTNLDLIYPVSNQLFTYLEPFPEREDGTRPTGFYLRQYNLETNQSQELFSVADLALPGRLDYQESNHSYYLLVGENTYSLGPF